MRKAHEFTTLPSERSDVTPAARALHRLAYKAVGYQWVDHAKHAHRQVQRSLEQGKEPRLDFWTQPGAYLQKQSPEVREKLRSLKSEDVQDFQVPRFALDEANILKTWHPDPMPTSPTVWHSGK